MIVCVVLSFVLVACSGSAHRTMKEAWITTTTTEVFICDPPEHLDCARADLYGATLPGANLGNADLSNANLENADLSNADLTGANLSYAELKQT